MTDAAYRYPNVFRPITLGPVALRNRIFVPAHTTNFGENNLPSDRHLAYHRARAAGGAAMIVFEGIRVHRSSLGRRQGVNGYGAGAVPGFARIARAVQAEGARLFGQIIHLGRHIDGAYARMSAWGASPIPWTATAPAPHPMTGAEIAEVVAAHAAVARNLIEAGLDGIELQMAHGHLIQQFLSPASNRRTDAYGGTEERRMRFARETLAAVREAVGDRAALGIRISADEFLEGGLALADMQRILPALLRDTPVDFVNVSHSAYHGSRTISTQMADMTFAADAFHHLPRGIAEALRAAGNAVPVFAVCRFRSIAEAEAMLADPHIAMIGMARAHIADPALVRKAAEEREEETRPCIACNQGCAGFLAQSLAITCLTNPATGREASWSPPGAPMRRAAAPRRVLVVGGGPAGMEAAAIAAMRGHDVTLWEASDRLGGALLWTGRMPLRREFLRLIEAQRAALARAGVRIETERCADAASIAAFGPEAVLLATGAEPAAARFPGGGEGLRLEQALAAPDALGARVAVVDLLGSWAVGAVVEFLAVLGKRVTVIAPTGQTGWHINIYSSFAWRHRLRQAGVRILGFRAVEAYRGGTTILTDLTTGATETEPFDSIIAPVHGVPRDTLAETCRTALTAQNEPVPVRLIGDCVSARSALEAVFEGHEAGREV
jgi:2,4-dienoyl-CoA reductase-like NADH-dependent reductase (Old Yellow Enzyme family)/thioredoxin reductase